MLINQRWYVMRSNERHIRYTYDSVVVIWTHNVWSPIRLYHTSICSNIAVPKPTNIHIKYLKRDDRYDRNWRTKHWMAGMALPERRKTKKSTIRIIIYHSIQRNINMGEMRFFLTLFRTVVQYSAVKINEKVVSWQ